MASPQLGLDPSPHRLVYRKLVEVLREDPVLSRVVNHWFAWEGETAHDQLDLAVGLCPAISLAPSMGSDRWYGPEAYLGPLHVHVGIAVAGTDADDLLDLYHAVKRAVYPADEAAGIAIHQALVEAGAEAMYLVEFTQGRFGVQADDDGGPMLVGTGQIKIDVKQGFAP